MVQVKEKVKQTHKEHQDALKVKEPRYLSHEMAGDVPIIIMRNVTIVR